MAGEWEDAPIGVAEGKPVIADGGWEDAPVDARVETSPGKEFVGSAASLLDLPLSLPGAIVGVGTSLGSVLAGAAAKPWTGESWKNIYKSALEQGGEVSEKLINPMQKILRAFNVEKEYEDAPAAKAMGFISEKIAEGADAVEKKTGIPTEGLQILANEILTLGIPGAGKAIAKGARGLNEFIAEKLPGEAGARGKLTDATIDDILKSYEEATGNPEKFTRDDVRAKTDADINAEGRAYELMQRGASKKEVETIRKREPLVGAKLDEMMARRQEVRGGPMKDVLQGEVLGPEEAAGVGAAEGPTGVKPAELGEAAPGQPRTPENLPQVPGVETTTGRFGESQRGSVDPEAAVKLGLAVGGTALGAALSEEPIGGALLGGLLGLGLGALPGSGLARGLEYAGGTVSTRVANISKPLWHRAIAHEMGIFENTHKALAAGDSFLLGLNKLPEIRQAELNSALLRNDFPAVEQALRDSGNPQLAQDWVNLRKTLDTVGKDLKQVGVLGQMRKDYFPRMVADREGLLNQMGFEQKTKLQEKLAVAEAAAIRRGESGLSPEESSSIINKFMQMRGTGAGGKPSFTKQRKIENLTPEMEKFYFSPTESYHTYIRNATKEIEKARFFGKDAVKVEQNGKPRIDIEQSIGQLVERELRQGKITPEQVPELSNLLRSRFVGGERVPSKFVQDARNYGNLALLGDLTSGLVQSGDAIMSIYQTGLRPTLRSVVQQVTGKQQVSMKDFGLADHISEEFVGTRRSAQILNTVLKPVFSKIDAWGKNTVLNSAINSAQKLAQTDAGVTKLGEKYAASFGEDFPLLISDLRSQQITPQVKLLAFHELSNLQPVSKLEMPQGYLDNPNGRIMYMLKSYQLKQFDILRRDAYQEIKSGNVAKGIANLTKLGITLGIAGATTSQVRSWILGVDDPLKTSEVWDNALKTFGWSSYVQDKVRKGKPAEAVAGLVAPPYKVIDTVMAQDPKAISYLPWFGKLAYYRGFGGAEKAEAYQAKRERTEKARQRKQGLAEGWDD